MLLFSWFMTLLYGSRCTEFGSQILGNAGDLAPFGGDLLVIDDPKDRDAHRLLFLGDGGITVGEDHNAGRRIVAHLFAYVIKDDVEENSAIVLGEYEDVMDWFNAIT